MKTLTWVIIAFVLGAIVTIAAQIAFHYSVMSAEQVQAGVAAMKVAAEAKKDEDAYFGGVPWYWIAFGAVAQTAFMFRLVIQWWATEKAKKSVVPTAFWIFSALGGVMLFTYFLRRGDPIGMLGQSFGIIVYARNLWFIFTKQGGAGGATEEVDEPVAKVAAVEE